MDENGIVYKRNVDSLPFAVLVSLFICLLLYGIFFRQNSLSEIIAGVFILVVLITLLIYLIKYRKDEVVEMAISLKGVYINGKGLYPWSLIESFTTTEYYDDGVAEKLTLHFSQYEDEEFVFTHLGIKRKELVTHLLNYKGTFTTYYKGHWKL
jgi:hypothetical protein